MQVSVKNVVMQWTDITEDPRQGVRRKELCVKWCSLIGMVKCETIPLAHGVN